jgi:hypothetical protein
MPFVRAKEATNFKDACPDSEIENPKSENPIPIAIGTKNTTFVDQ